MSPIPVVIMLCMDIISGGRPGDAENIFEASLHEGDGVDEEGPWDV